MRGRGLDNFFTIGTSDKLFWRG